MKITYLLSNLFSVYKILQITLLQCSHKKDLFCFKMVISYTFFITMSQIMVRVILLLCALIHIKVTLNTHKPRIDTIFLQHHSIKDYRKLLSKQIGNNTHMDGKSKSRQYKMILITRNCPPYFLKEH